VQGSSESNSTEPNEECDQPVGRSTSKHRVDRRQLVPGITIGQRSSERRHDKVRSLNGKIEGGKINSYLCHDSEERSRHALLVRESALGDEQRPTREHKIRSEYYNYRTGKAVRPIDLAVLDKGEEDVPKCRQKRAETCIRLMPLCA